MEQDSERNKWLIKLFSKSVLKQAKLRELKDALGEVQETTCLDLGYDNGVISYYLRELGGTWYSADLTDETVSSIRSLVNKRVWHFDEKQFPCEDSIFDTVVVVDMLEHVKDDNLFVAELYRILKPGGRLVINAPNAKPYSPLRALRKLIGQTDEAHGHLRAGYGRDDLEQLVAGRFQIVTSHSYSRFFTELLDTCIVFAYGLISGTSSQPSEEPSKGLVVTEDKLKQFHKTFQIYSVVYPFFCLFSKLDYLIPFIPGFMRLTVLKRSS